MKIPINVLTKIGKVCNVDTWERIGEGYYRSRDVFLYRGLHEVHYAITIYESGFWILYLTTYSNNVPMQEVYHGWDISNDAADLNPKYFLLSDGVALDKIRSE